MATAIIAPGDGSPLSGQILNPGRDMADLRGSPSLLPLISRPVGSAAEHLSCDLENGFDLHGGSKRERADPDGRPRMTSVVAENLHE